MLFGKCINCNALVGAYSATSQIVRCPKCGELNGFKGSKTQQVALYSIMVIAMMIFTNYEYQSILSYYLVGSPLFFCIYIVSCFSLSQCDSEKVRFRRKIKDFDFNIFVLSNVVHAILFSLLIPSGFYALDGVTIIG